MSHLPPRPEFDYILRQPPKFYGRATPPPDIIPVRDRDAYRGSPPRPKYPPRADSYTAPGGSYVPRQSYPPPFDRHEDDHYRRRDWERRESDYVPPPFRGEPRGWRDRDRDRRREDERPRGYDRDRRDRSPPRERWARPREDERRPARDRARPPSPERTWVPRASKSPPRRKITTGQASGLNEIPTSPPTSPRRRARSPSTRNISPPSPVLSRYTKRADTYGNSRLGNHSISASPRRPQSRSRLTSSRQGRYHPEDPPRDWSNRRRRRSHSRSWSRSRSPIRRSISPSSRRRSTSRGRGRSRASSDRKRGRSRSTDSESGVAYSRERTPQKGARATRRSSSHSRVAERRVTERARSLTPAKREPPSTKLAPNADRIKIWTEGLPTDVRMASPPRAATSTRKLTPVPAPTSVPHRSAQAYNSSSPPPSATLQIRRNGREHVRTPTSPMSPQVNSPFTPLPPKPEWTSRKSPSTPPTSAEPPPVPPPAPDPVFGPPLPDVPEIPRWVPPQHPILVNGEFGRLLARKERSTTDYIEAARESRRALHEYDMACADLEFAKKKRNIASVQLELARAGDLGIEYKPPENE